MATTTAPPSTLKDLYRSSDAQAYRDRQKAAAAPPPPSSPEQPQEPRGGGGGRFGGDAEAAADDSANRTEDLEHLFGGSDLSTAVKALYDFGAPHEFFGSLNRFVKRKDAEIEDVCSNYYQEFIRSNQELLGVRVDIRELRGEVTGLNDEIQEAGKVYLQKCERLIELRQMRHNSRSLVGELKGCCKVLEMCARATEQMASRQYYPRPQDAAAARPEAPAGALRPRVRRRGRRPHPRAAGGDQAARALGVPRVDGHRRGGDARRRRALIGLDAPPEREGQREGQGQGSRRRCGPELAEPQRGGARAAAQQHRLRRVYRRGWHRARLARE